MDNTISTFLKDIGLTITTIGLIYGAFKYFFEIKIKQKQYDDFIKEDKICHEKYEERLKELENNIKDVSHDREIDEARQETILNKLFEPIIVRLQKELQTYVDTKTSLIQKDIEYLKTIYQQTQSTAEETHKAITNLSNALMQNGKNKTN